MEKRPMSPKLLFIVIGVLLVVVAAGAAAFFGGANLLTPNPVVAQPAAEEQLVPVTSPGLDQQRYEFEDGYREGCGHDTMSDEDL